MNAFLNQNQASPPSAPFAGPAVSAKPGGASLTSGVSMPLVWGRAALASGPVCEPAALGWPGWSPHPRVRWAFSGRHGGVSQPPFDRFNLGDHVGDAPAAVAHNRAAWGAALAARSVPKASSVRPIYLHQVHGMDCLRLAKDSPDGLSADAALALVPGLACTVMVADCLPVLFCHAGGAAVAAAHAGWRGLAGQGGWGVLEAAFEAWCEALLPIGVARDRRALAQQTRVWLGPCIGPSAFEVGLEVQAALQVGVPAAQRPSFDAAFVPLGAGKCLADLAALARLRLSALGLQDVSGNDSGAAWCTHSQASWFFSHRRDAAGLGSSGRMAASIWLVD